MAGTVASAAFAILLAAAAGQALGAIDRAAVVRRHNVHFTHDFIAKQIDDDTAYQVLTVGNGEIGFTTDLTGLQSLNTSFGSPRFPLYTLSNWGWHTPDAAELGIQTAAFNPDGSLNYVYENVTINSSDTRHGKGDRTVPYQFNCASYNDPALCDFWHKFPARANLGQLGFVVPGHPPPPPPPIGPTAGCDAVGVWCNAHQVTQNTDGKYYCELGHNITVEIVRGGSMVASTEHGWKDAPFAVDGSGEIVMTGVTKGKANHGFFSTCNSIKWNNSFDTSRWCRAGSIDCAPSGGSADFTDAEFQPLDLKWITNTSQSLDMYSGLLSSNFSVHGNAVQVDTVVDQDSDTISATFVAPPSLGLSVQLAFCGVSRTGAACSWSDPFPTKTTLLSNSGARLDVFRENGADSYSVSCVAASGGSWHQTSGDSFVLSGASEVSCSFALNCCVGPKPPAPKTTLSHTTVPTFAQCSTNAVAAWKDFWEGGAMVDISSKTDDPRAAELERRTIQSAYLLRSQESGSIMPQESGLLYNSWTGKHHSEMRYWHQTWLPLWGHPELLAKSDQWFIDRLTNATSNTAFQGYSGARWGKMLGESNIYGLGKGTSPVMYWESPNNINPGLVWHQPHVVYMSELEYRAAKLKGGEAAATEVLHRLKDVVLATASFIGDFPERRRGTGTNGKFYDLGPPLVSASEGEGPYDVWNPTYELTQFNFSLDLANQWLVRLGLPKNDSWENVRMNLAPLPVTVAPGGTKTYNRHQNCLPSVFSDHPQHCSGHRSHPALNGAMGCLPGQLYGVDRNIMNATLHETLNVWSWNSCWGWDQPMVAMTATRLEQPEEAINTLLMNATTNVYLPTGYNHPDNEGLLAAYLPGNGGLLSAVALMAGGWVGAPTGEAPGFPPEWHVQAEGFTPYF